MRQMDTLSDEIKSEIAQSNLYRTRIIALILTALLVILTVRLFVGDYVSEQSQERGMTTLLLLYGILIFFLMAYLISTQIFLKYEKKNDWKGTYYLSFSGILGVVLICALVSTVDQFIHGQITMYIAGMFGIAALIYLSLLEACVVFFAPLIVLLFGITFLQPELTLRLEYYVNSIVITLAAFIFSRLLFGYHKNHVEDINTIKAQNIELEKKRRDLEDLSLHDSLTKLYNRRYIADQLENLIEAAKRTDRTFSIAIGDLDHFKQINDTFSHQAGDRVLLTVADLFRRTVRKIDMISRYGGEEFLFIFPETPLSEAYAICERIRGSLESYPWHVIHPDLKATISIGVKEVKPGESHSQVIKETDNKLYRAKHLGRNRTIK